MLTVCVPPRAHSIIMLHTDLHNPQNKKRMTKEEFVKNNRGIDGGKDVPRQLLEAVYDNIKSKKVCGVPVCRVCVSVHLETLSVCLCGCLTEYVCSASGLIRLPSPLSHTDPDGGRRELNCLRGGVANGCRRRLRHRAVGRRHEASN